MRLKEVLKKISFKDYKITFKDLYGNEYEMEDFYASTLYKIEELEVRNANINFKRKEATFYLIGFYELLEDKRKGRLIWKKKKNI